ncbi:MAG: hypothetical protein WC346_04445 [Methanogenium sp.]|jgi:hypothetical protein
MEKDLIKKISLLRYYSSTGTKINLKIKNNSQLKINGIICDKSFIFGEKYIIIRNDRDHLIKIFIDEIILESIIPEGYIENENIIKDKPINEEYVEPIKKEVKLNKERSMFFRPKQ